MVNRDLHLVMSTARIENEVVRAMIDEARQPVYVDSRRQEPPCGRKLLHGILDEIVFIPSVESIGALDRYPLYRIVRRAVERSLELVGEAVAQPRRGRTDLSTQIPDAATITAFLNVLAHEYR